MAQLSGSDVSKVESDISQTVSLADSVVTLVREPISLLYNNYNKTKKLKQSLGAWQGEALDTNGQSRIPVLGHDEFEAHLVATDGNIEYHKSTKIEEDRRASLGEKFRSYWASSQQLPRPSLSPELPNAGAACWSYFLYALGIHPGMDIVYWRPAMDGYINTQNGGVEMEIDGSALCHIINLYSTRLDRNKYGRRRVEIPNIGEKKQCKFPFGELAWDTVNGETHAHFRPGLEKELAGTKIPFGSAGQKLEPGTMIASYLTALDIGVLDASFQLLDPTAPISDRINRFSKFFKTWRDKPLIISRDWFEEAARIKRRVLAEGGSNRSFYEDIEKAIYQDEKAEAWARHKSYLKREIRDRFFLDEDDRFRFYLESGSRPSANPAEEWVIELPRRVLESYKDHPLGSWKRTLYETRAEVLEVLEVCPDVYIEKWMLLLDFTRSSEFWDEKVLLGAPICK